MTTPGGSTPAFHPLVVAVEVMGTKEAAAWLKRQSLIDGIGTDETAGPVRSYLTDEGVDCAEGGSDVSAWVDGRRRPATGSTVEIGGNFTGNLTTGGHHVTQTVTLTANSEQFALVLRGLVEAFRGVAGEDDAEIGRLEMGALSGIEEKDVEPTKTLLDRMSMSLKSGTKSAASTAMASFVAWGAQMLEQVISSGFHH